MQRIILTTVSLLTRLRLMLVDAIISYPSRRDCLYPSRCDFLYPSRRDCICRFNCEKPFGTSRPCTTRTWWPSRRRSTFTSTTTRVPRYVSVLLMYIKRCVDCVDVDVVAVVIYVVVVVCVVSLSLLFCFCCCASSSPSVFPRTIACAWCVRKSLVNILCYFAVNRLHPLPGNPNSFTAEKKRSTLIPSDLYPKHWVQLQGAIYKGRKTATVQYSYGGDSSVACGAAEASKHARFC